MQEGRRMFQIFAARMFEQRVLTAYKEKVAAEKGWEVSSQKLIYSGLYSKHCLEEPQLIPDRQDPR